MLLAFDHDVVFGLLVTRDSFDITCDETLVRRVILAPLSSDLC